MTGPEHEVLLKTKRVALIHNGIQEARVMGNDYHPFLPKLEEAMDALVGAVMDYEEWKAEQDASKN